MCVLEMNIRHTLMRLRQPKGSSASFGKQPTGGIYHLRALIKQITRKQQGLAVKGQEGWAIMRRSMRTCSFSLRLCTIQCSSLVSPVTHYYCISQVHLGFTMTHMQPRIAWTAANPSLVLDLQVQNTHPSQSACRSLSAACIYCTTCLRSQRQMMSLASQVS